MIAGKILMKTIQLVLLICMLCLVSTGIGLASETNDISITSSADGLDVIETIDYMHPSDLDELREYVFWVDSDASSVQIYLVDNDTQLAYVKEGNLHRVNLSVFNATLSADDQASFRITYILPVSLETFNKVLKHDTSSLTITYKNIELFQGEDLAAESRQHIRLYVPSEAPLNTLYIGIVVVLVVLLMFMVLLLMRKQRKKTRKALNESQELLALKKNLLLSLLKDIEKKHRAKDISDDTYSKLKEEYKQQAVEVMKHLDDVDKKD